MSVGRRAVGRSLCWLCPAGHGSSRRCDTLSQISRERNSLGMVGLGSFNEKTRHPLLDGGRVRSDWRGDRKPRAPIPESVCLAGSRPATTFSLQSSNCVMWPGPGMIRRHTDFQSVALPTELPGRRLQVRREPLPQASSAQDAIYSSRSCQRDVRTCQARNANKAGIRPAAIVWLHYERKTMNASQGRISSASYPSRIPYPCPIPHPRRSKSE